MDRVTRADLTRLAESGGEPAVSIYMPTIRASAEVRQNRIRFKNLVTQAADELERRGSPEAVREQLEAARPREPDDTFWQHQSDGLALFVTADRCEMHRLPRAFSERVEVGPDFYVRPLLPIVQSDAPFYVLAASQNSVRLLSGTQYQVAELDVEGMPPDLRAALNIDEYVSSLQHHSAGMATGVAGSTIFHGQGGSGLEVRKKDELLQFFHRLDRALTSFLGSNGAPLIFAGVEYLFPLFQSTCEYAALVEQPVTGNPDHLSAEQLHAKAWPVVERSVPSRSEQARDRYERLAGSDLVTDELPAILRACKLHQIESLFLAEDQEVRGTCDETGAAHEHEGPETSDLLNWAAVRTLDASGEVFSLPAERMPTAAPATALLRFPLIPPQDEPRAIVPREI